MNLKKSIFLLCIIALCGFMFTGCEDETGLPGDANLYICMDDYTHGDLSKYSVLDEVSFGDGSQNSTNVVGTSRDKGVVTFEQRRWRAFKLPKEAHALLHIHINTQDGYNHGYHTTDCEYDLKNNEWLKVNYMANSGFKFTPGSYILE